MTRVAQRVLRRAEQGAVETPRLGVGADKEYIHGLMLAGFLSTLNSQLTSNPTILLFVAATCLAVIG